MKYPESVPLHLHSKFLAGLFIVFIRAFSFAPWQVHICVLRQDDPVVAEKANKLYKDLEAEKVDVLFDDRNCGAGIKFNDADLMGMPIRVVISPKSLQNNEIEITIRKTKESYKVSYDNALREINSLIAKLEEEYK